MNYRHALAMAVALACVTVPVQSVLADSNTNFGSDVADEQDIINALNPNAPAKPVYKTRGIKLSTQPPTGGEQQVSAPPPPAATPEPEPAVVEAAPEPAAPAPAEQQAVAVQSQPAEAPEPAPAQSSASPSIALQIQFEYNSAKLTSHARDQLHPLGTALNSPELAPYSFRFEGHTDASGGYAYNLMLSKQRADSVKAYLVANYGVDSGRIIAIGRGPDELLTPEDPNNAANRRVEIITMRQ